MKLLQFFAAISVVTSVGFTNVSAQDSDKPERPKRAQKAEQGERPNRPDRPGRPGQGDAEAGPGLGQMLRRLPLMMALDADADGVLSAEEIEGAVAALKKLDKNGDGKLTLDELRPEGPFIPGARPGRPGEGDEAAAAARFEQMFSTRDSNGDGKLTGDEIPEMLRDRMERVDENADGAIQKEELMKAMARLGRGGGRPDGSRPPGARLGNDKERDGSGVKPRRPTSDDPN